MTNRIEFVSYNGKFPCYCSGTWVFRIDCATVAMPEYSIMRGYKDEDGRKWVKGFTEDIPALLAPLMDAIIECANANVECYCCGGCE